jgi:Putative adhesin
MAATTVPLPLTRGRAAALVIGVPVCLLLVAGTGLNLVATFGEGRYPVSYAVPATAKSLNVTMAGGQLTLLPTTASQATLTGTARYSLVRSKLTERATGSGTTVGYHCSVPFGDCELDATINVPAGLIVTAATDGGNAAVTGIASEVTLSSGGGSIGADHISGPLTLNTSGGNVRASAITSATMTASTGGGDIHLAGVRSRTISATTSGGNIDATGISAGAVTATSGGGNIEIEFTSVPSGVEVDTSGGNITLVLPPGDTAYHVAAHTNGGEVTDTLLQDTGSRNVITATSGGGNITIRQQ